MKVIAISGKAQHGKDAFASLLKERLEKKYNRSVLVTRFSGLLKYICKEFFGWDGNKDEEGRALLQYVGTDKVRAVSPDYWVDFVANVLNLFKDEWDYVLIPDCRFPNEYELLKDYGLDTTLVRITRPNFESPLTKEQQCHTSETALDNYEYDAEIINDGNLIDLNVDAWIFAEKIEENNSGAQL